MKIDHSEARQGTPLIPEGNYEGIIKYAGYKTTKGGTEYIGIDIVIRPDVDQDMQNEMIERPLWRRKNPTKADQACGNFSAGEIQAVSKCAGMENGKEYESLEAWMKDLSNRLIKITVGHEIYKDKPQARVTWLSETEHPECDIKYDIAEQLFGDELSAFEPVNDAELPF